MSDGNPFHAPGQQPPPAPARRLVPAKVRQLQLIIAIYGVLGVFFLFKPGFQVARAVAAGMGVFALLCLATVIGLQRHRRWSRWASAVVVVIVVSCGIRAVLARPDSSVAIMIAMAFAIYSLHQLFSDAEALHFFRPG
jgi:drug/metabolite transporter (DMT)-like permease